MLESTKEVQMERRILVRKLTTKESLVQRRVVLFRTVESGGAHARASGGTVLHLARVLLSKSEGLCTTELGSILLELAKAHLTFLLVVLVLHLNVVLGKALCPVVGEELAIAAIEDVHFGVGELWVLEVVDSTVTVAHKLGHAGSTKLGVFTVENEQSLCGRVSFEELLSQLLLVVEVESTIDVASVVLVFETAIDDVDTVVVSVVVAAENIEESVLLDPRQAIGLIFREEVRKLGLVDLVHVHIHLRRVGLIVLATVLHDIVGMLEHAERTTNLLPGR